MPGGFSLQCEGDVQIVASRATHVERSVLLGIQVQQTPPLQKGVVQFCGTCQSGLLVDGEEEFEGRVYAVGICGRRQSHGNAYAVVGTEGSTLRQHPVTVPDHFDGIG